MKKRLIIFSTTFTIACIISTQIFAYYFNYQPALGYNILHVYNPFSIFEWWYKYKTVDSVIRYLNISFYTGAIFILIITALQVFIFSKSTQKDTHGSGRFSTIKELKKWNMLFDDYNTDGVILAKTKNGKNIIENEKTNILLAAPSRAGKGVGPIVQTLLNWKESTLTLDLKGENWLLTAWFRKNVLKQKVLKFAPYGQDSCSYNCLAQIRVGTMYEYKDVQIISDILTEPENGKRDHWCTSASTMLAGCMLHVLYSIKETENRVAGLSDVIDLLTNPEKPLTDVLNDLRTYKHSNDITLFHNLYGINDNLGVNPGTHPKVARMAAEALNKGENELAGIISTINTNLALFKDPIIRKNTTAVDFTINDLMNYDIPINLYVVIEAEATATLAPIVRILLTQLVGGLCIEIKDTQASIHKHRLLLMLDEFPNWGKIPVVEIGSGYWLGYGIKAVFICQSKNQIDAKYGKNNGILGNCNTSVYYSPSPEDNETPKFLSETLGKKTITLRNRSMTLNKFNSGSTSESNFGKPLMATDEVRTQLGEDKLLILMSQRYPTLAYKTRFYQIDYFKKRVCKAKDVPLTDRIEHKYK